MDLYSMARKPNGEFLTCCIPPNIVGYLVIRVWAHICNQENVCVDIYMDIDMDMNVCTMGFMVYGDEQ